MLTCQGCIRHCLQTIVGDALSISSKPGMATASNISRPFRRNFASAYFANRIHAVDSPDEKPSWHTNTQKRIAGRETKLGETVPTVSRVPRRRKKDHFTEREATLHLKYLKDPIKLAEFVRKTLREENHELAQRIVEEASSTTPCTVSWNHIIEWHLSKGKMNAALKCYNQMKKRAQVPDAQTYTIIFNGCSQHKDSVQALAKVLTMYNSMLTEKAPVKPNTIHLNAVLKMCARAGNMEAMFSIVDQMPTKGLTAPNNLTYTTILNALRMHALNNPRGTMTPMQRRQAQEKTILQARHIWAAVVKAWRQGDLWIDEELVCAMGRLLLIGNEQDQDDIMSLIEQTMNIPRQIPRKGTLERHRLDPASQGQDPAPVEVPLLKDSAAQDPEPAADASPEPIAPIGFPKSVEAEMYPIPRQNTLSLVIQSLAELHLKDAAAKYWKIFTNDYNVVPDAENFHAYLRVLRLSRSSTETTNLMMKMPRTYMQAKTFRIAMSTCARDKNNQHAFANAGKVLDMMQNALREPEIQALQSYLELSLTAPAHSTSNRNVNKYEQGKQIRRALERLSPSFINLKAALHFRHPSLPKLSQQERLTFVDNILSIVRRMISAYDILMNNAMVPREDYVELTQARSKLSAFVTRHKLSNPYRGEKDSEKPSKLVAGAQAAES